MRVTTMRLAAALLLAGCQPHVDPGDPSPASCTPGQNCPTGTPNTGQPPTTTPTNQPPTSTPPNPPMHR